MTAEAPRPTSGDPPAGSSELYAGARQALAAKKADVDGLLCSDCEIREANPLTGLGLCAFCYSATCSDCGKTGNVVPAGPVTGGVDRCVTCQDRWESEEEVDAAQVEGLEGGRRVVGRTAASVVAAPVRWAWQDRVPLGSVTLNAGREGIGKGVLSSWMAARWSRGQLPGDLAGVPINVAILSIEDSAEHVLRPRLEAAGADLEMVLFVHAEERDGAVVALEFPTDIDGLADYLVAGNITVLVVDVATAFLRGEFDSHKDHDVRRGFMTPVGLLAERLGIAVVINHHLNRAATTAVLDRVAGSLGVSRACRSVLAIVENPEAPEERVVVLAKSNLGVLEVPALRFRIDGAEVGTPAGIAKTGQAVMLGETVGVTARNALRPREDDEERSAHDEAVEVLEDLLAAGPLSATAAKRQAADAGISARTLARAKKTLGVRSVKVGQPGDKEQGWKWELPAEGCQPPPKNDEECQSISTAPFDEVGTLRDEA